MESGMDIKKNIQALLKMWEDGEITGYRIAKDVGIKPNLNQYRDGYRKIDNMSLSKAIKLNDYYLELKREKEKQIMKDAE